MPRAARGAGGLPRKTYVRIHPFGRWGEPMACTNIKADLRDQGASAPLRVHVHQVRRTLMKSINEQPQSARADAAHAVRTSVRGGRARRDVHRGVRRSRHQRAGLPGHARRLAAIDRPFPVGGTQQFTATGTDAAGVAVTVSPAWSVASAGRHDRRVRPVHRRQHARHLHQHGRGLERWPHGPATVIVVAGPLATHHRHAESGVDGDRRDPAVHGRRQGRGG